MFTDRDTQDLLIERRLNMEEARRAQCPAERALLAWHVATIDQELARRGGRAEPDPQVTEWLSV